MTTTLLSSAYKTQRREIQAIYQMQIVLAGAEIVKHQFALAVPSHYLMVNDHFCMAFLEVRSFNRRKLHNFC